MATQSANGWVGLIGGVALALVALAQAPALAHHGWGGYSDKEFELSGTVVKSVSLAGPHATMQIKDADGRVWDLTLAPPYGTERAGVKDGFFAVGEKVSIHGHRHKDPNHFEVKTERVTWNGKVYNVYPDRE
jgi:hypothetical protein